MPFLIRFKDFCSHLAAVAGERFQLDLLNLRAMGLTYTTLLSLVPFLAVMFSVLKGFGVQNQLEPLLAQALEPLGPEGAEVSHRIIAFVNNLNLQALGTAGLAGLFFTTISLIGQVEDGFNHIWQVRRSRSLARKFSDYLSVVLVGPVLIFTAFTLLASAQSYWLIERIIAFQPFGFIVHVLTRIMPIILLATAFTFLYKFLPYAEVPFRSALFGGVIAGLLWHFVGMGFTAFVAASAHYQAVYSSFAVLILFLLWLYMGWLIVLIGAEITYLHQNPMWQFEGTHRQQQSHLFMEQLALALLVAITRRYLAREPPCSLASLAESLQAPISNIEELVDEFVQEGILIRTLEPEGIALGCPPELIAVSELIEMLQLPGLAGGMEARDGPKLEVLQRRDAAVREALQGVTLRTLATDEHA